MMSPDPGPDFIHYDSGFCTGPSPEFIKQVRAHVRVRILCVSSPGPDFIKHVWVHVRILPTPGLEAILVMRESFEQISIATSHGGSI